MSKRNTIREYDIPAFYHVYNRGAHKSKIYHDGIDKQKFINILARYLDPEDQSIRADGIPYEKSSAKLVAYCLMGNHYHLLLYQENELDAIQRLVPLPI